MPKLLEAYEVVPEYLNLVWSRGLVAEEGIVIDELREKTPARAIEAIGSVGVSSRSFDMRCNFEHPRLHLENS